MNGEERKAKIMFTNISWADYLVVITLLLTTYYLVIAIRFYYHELQTFIMGWLKADQAPMQPEASQVPAPLRRVAGKFRNP